MKPIKLEGFRIPAQHMAELLWGKGGTHSYKTSRRGAYYYSCSGHGGYVVDSRCLTAQERRKLDRYTVAQNLHLLVQHQAEGDFVIGVNCVNFQSMGPYRTKSYRYIPRLGRVEWVPLPVYVFEEDCDWAILEHLTPIRCENHTVSKVCIKQTFKRWCPPRQAALPA